jgi:hypothetical protein
LRHDEIAFAPAPEVKNLVVPLPETEVDRVFEKAAFIGRKTQSACRGKPVVDRIDLAGIDRLFPDRPGKDRYGEEEVGLFEIADKFRERMDRVVPQNAGDVAQRVFLCNV